MPELVLTVERENQYLQRMNRVLDYVREHVAEDLAVPRLAAVACFSPFHFHRLFTVLVGETVNQHVGRVRLERAVALLKGSPTLPITTVAFACGFRSASSFSRAFKQRFGITAREWDRVVPLHERKNGQVFAGFQRYSVEELSDVAERHEFGVEVRTLPAQRFAHIRVANSYQPERVVAAYERLIAWYRARGGELAATTLLGMSQDDPEVTPLAKCRYDIGLTVPEGWQGMGEVTIRRLPTCQVAAVHCVGDIYQVDRAWQYLYRYWLPRSRYQPANLPAIERYRRQPLELGWETYDLECVVPVTLL